MSDLDDDLFDDTFHVCALRAYLEQAYVQGSWPDSEATRRRAYRHYEAALAERRATGDASPRAVDAKQEAGE